jgi:hypothetical protein
MRKFYSHKGSRNPLILFYEIQMIEKLQRYGSSLALETFVCLVFTVLFHCLRLVWVGFGLVCLFDVILVFNFGGYIPFSMAINSYLQVVCTELQNSPYSTRKVVDHLRQSDIAYCVWK